MSNNLDSDEAPHYVGPHLDPNYLQNDINDLTIVPLAGKKINMQHVLEKKDLSGPVPLTSVALQFKQIYSFAITFYKLSSRFRNLKYKILNTFNPD